MAPPSGWLRRALLLGPSCLGLAAGCAWVPAGQLDECRKRSLALQSENARLKDLSVSLRSQNEDLTARAVADARRQRLQDESIERLEASVQAYQDEREKLATAYERLKDGISTAPGPLSRRLNDRLREFARSRPGCTFDPASGTLALRTGDLFQAGTDRLKPGARACLQALANLLAEGDAETEASRVGLTVAPPGAADPGVRRASTADDPAQALPAARAARVREWLATEGRLGSARVALAGTPSGSRQITIRLQPR